jgi:hypothetical protein
MTSAATAARIWPTGTATSSPSADSPEWPPINKTPSPTAVEAS